MKEDTRDLHEAAATHVRILGAGATLPDYRDYLRAMYGFHTPIEEILAADPVLDEAGFEAHARRKGPLALRDLRALGDADAPAWCTCLPAADSLVRRIGVAYVLEHATLGGRFLLSRLPPALASAPTGFLIGYGAATAARWRSFCALAESVLGTSVAEDEAVAAARDTLERLASWLARDARMKAAS